MGGGLTVPPPPPQEALEGIITPVPQPGVARLQGVCWAWEGHPGEDRDILEECGCPPEWGPDRDGERMGLSYRQNFWGFCPPGEPFLLGTGIRA